MAKIILSKEAREDLIQIGCYTQEKWGKEQRLKYLEQFQSIFKKLAEGQVKGRQRNELVGAPLSYREGSHIIFYHEIKKGIEVLRVLHKRMDFEKHFLEP